MAKDLFGTELSDPFFSGKVLHNFQPTSRESAEFLEKGKHAKRRKEVFNFIRDQGEYGATDEEVEIATGLPHQTVSGSAGRNGLLSVKLVRDSGKTRKNRSGRNAIVWVVNNQN